MKNVHEQRGIVKLTVFACKDPELLSDSGTVCWILERYHQSSANHKNKKINKNVLLFLSKRPRPLLEKVPTLVKCWKANRPDVDLSLGLPLLISGSKDSGLKDRGDW
jgi:hypothetical protein